MSQSTVSPDLSVIENRPPNVGRQFFDRVQSSPNREAYRYPKGDEWQSVTWKETGDQVTRLAAGLVALGVEPEQRVGLHDDAVARIALPVPAPDRQPDAVDIAARHSGQSADAASISAMTA